MEALQSAVRLLYPDACLICGGRVAGGDGLCAGCWAETPFITGFVCDGCGVPLPGAAHDGHRALCDDCLDPPRPWERGRAALLYEGGARRFVLALKHGDRAELAAPAARWMARAGAGLFDRTTLVAPVPAHWLRLALRRYNQAALLAQALARQTCAPYRPDLLTRIRRTRVQDGMSREARFANTAGAIRATARGRVALPGRSVLLVDDVMTSGATLAAASQACLAAGAARVSVLVLARVAKAP